ncbi:hypothetical protein Tco_1208087 [Tanacetum coccineum]
MADDDDDNISELPLGYIYHLTDSDVITILNLKLQNIPLEFNMYVIYTPRYRVKGSTEIGRRVLGGKVGIWKQVSNYQYRCDDVGNAIGKRGEGGWQDGRSLTIHLLMTKRDDEEENEDEGARNDDSDEE